MQLKNLHAIHVRYIGPTDTKGSRIKLISKRFGQSVTLDRDYATNPLDQATDYLESHGFSLVGTTDDGAIILTTTFEPIR